MRPVTPARTLRTSAPPELRDYLRSPQIKSRLARLQKPSARHFLAGVAFNYAVIITAVIICAFSIGTRWLLLAYPLAIIAIAARQHGLLILMHDATHYLACQSRRRNEWLGELLTAAPLFTSMHNYRINHLAHHRELNTFADPDWVRKIGPVDERPHWLFPSNQSVVALFLKLYKRSIGYLLRSLKDNSTGKALPSHSESGDGGSRKDAPRSLRTIRNLGYLVVAVALSYYGVWGYFIGLWLVPAFLMLPALMRLRSIAEHFALPHDHPLRESRNLLPGRLERFLLAPHNVGAHLAHHCVASVPAHNLPALHALLMQCAYYRRHSHNNNGYLMGQNSLLKDMYRQTSVRLPRESDGDRLPKAVMA